MTERVRQARYAKSWSQSRLIYEIDRYAEQHKIQVASPASLKVYVSEWENGRRAVTPPYTAILRALFGLTDAELFAEPTEGTLIAADGYDELVAHIEAARSIGPSDVGTLLDQTEIFRTLDRKMGATQLVDSMTRHLEILSEALAFTILPGDRTPIASALAGAASLAAWQALDVGAVDRAWRNYELAKSSALQAGKPVHLAHSMGEQAYVLVDAGRVDQASELIEASLGVSQAIPNRLKAWLMGVKAEIAALDGRYEICRRALDEATAVLPDDDLLRDPEIPSVFLTEAHLARWRGHSLALLGDNQALGELYEAFHGMDSTFTRAKAGLLCDLAQAHLVRGEHGDARERLREAKRIAHRTGSVRYLRQVERITGRLP